MAALADSNPTLLDLARVTEADGKIATIVEIMAQINEVLDHLGWVPGNLVTGNMTTIRAGLPAPTWRKMYQFVQPTKGRTAQITDNCGMMEDYAEVDKALADLNGNAPAWRLGEDRAHIQGISQSLATKIFYGNEGTEPEAFTGLSPRFNALSGAGNSENVISAGGSGQDNGSIWLCVWGPDTGFGIIPKGSVAGLQHRDLGEVTVQDSSGGRMQMYRSHYRMDAGLTIRDWRYFVRICNIDKSNLTKDAATGADLPDLMFQAMNKVPNLSVGRAVWYMSRDMKTMLGRQTANLTKGSTLTTELVGGKMVSSYQGIPVARVDALSADETVVS